MSKLLNGVSANDIVITQEGEIAKVLKIDSRQDKNVKIQVLSNNEIKNVYGINVEKLTNEVYIQQKQHFLSRLKQLEEGMKLVN